MIFLNFFFLFHFIASMGTTNFFNMQETTSRFIGICDASAAAALDEDKIIVADDESNLLRIYSISAPGAAISTVDLNAHLGVQPGEKDSEADIEAVAALGDTLFWITSHGRNKNGKYRARRYGFFSTKIDVQSEVLSVLPAGQVYKNLISDLTDYDAEHQLGLQAATRLDVRTKKGKIRDLKALAPKDQGLNIEGLCRSADGKSLLIGFRNPRPKQKALLVPLLNPQALVAGKETARFGAPVLLDLRGLGIRGIVHNENNQRYYIIAGRHDAKDEFWLCSWSGKDDMQPEFEQHITGLNPEAVILYPKLSKLMLISDDGGMPAGDGNGECKDMKDATRKSFRSMWIELKDGRK